jgi:hypothetical protein
MPSTGPIATGRPVVTVPPSVVRWAFFSPARLALVCLAVGLVIVGAVLLATRGSPAETRAVRPAETTTPRSQPSPSIAPTATSSEPVGPAARRHVTRTARAFVDVWVSGRSMSRSAWHAALEPLTTTSLYRGLRSADPSRLPSGASVTDARLEQLGPFAGTAIVMLTGGTALDVHLVAQHDGWVVSNIRPAGT